MKKVTQAQLNRLRSGGLTVRQILCLLREGVLDHFIENRPRKRRTLFRFYEAYYVSSGMGPTSAKQAAEEFVSTIDDLSDIIDNSDEYSLQKKYARIRDLCNALLNESIARRELEKQALSKLQRRDELLDRFFSNVRTTFKHTGGLQGAIKEARKAQNELGIVSVYVGKKTDVNAQFLKWLNRVGGEVAEYHSAVFERSHQILEAAKDGDVGRGKLNVHTVREILSFVDEASDNEEEKESIRWLIANLFSLTEPRYLDQRKRALKLGGRLGRKELNMLRRKIRDRIRKLEQRGVKTKYLKDSWIEDLPPHYRIT
jgi:hypothetical protein